MKTTHLRKCAYALRDIIVSKEHLGWDTLFSHEPLEFRQLLGTVDSWKIHLHSEALWLE